MDASVFQTAQPKPKNVDFIPLAADAPPAASALVKAGRAQEAAWLLREEGRIAEGDAVEEALVRHLKDAPIASMRRLRSSGLSLAYLVEFADGTQAVFKPQKQPTPEGSRNTDMGAELATYWMDRRLGLNSVPVTVAREIQGMKGSLQFVMRPSRTFFDCVKQGLLRESPENSRDSRLGLLHFMVFNTDPNQNNVLLLPDQGFRRVSIDHGRAFVSMPPGQLATLLLDARSRARDWVPDAEMRARLEALDDATLRRELKGMLRDYHIEQLIERREALLKILRDKDRKDRKDPKP